MASQAISGVGVIFQRWNGSEWESVAEITAIKGPGMKRETIEVTNLDSLDGYKEFIAGFRDPGSVSLSMNYRRETYDLMIADFETNDKQNYQIVLPDALDTSFEFEGLVIELPLSITTKDAITTDTTIQVSGKVVINDGQNSDSPKI
jgi:predicted secreted protein